MFLKQTQFEISDSNVLVFFVHITARVSTAVVCVACTRRAAHLGSGGCPGKKKISPGKKIFFQR
jgi:hypothetical protein